MRYQYHDGGRSDAGIKGRGGDCGIRAVAIALDVPYLQAKRRMNDCIALMTGGMITSVASGVNPCVMHQVLSAAGWTASKSSGYLSDIPIKGRWVAYISGHYIAIIDGVALDTWNSTVSKRTRCGSPKLKGYWS